MTPFSRPCIYETVTMDVYPIREAPLPSGFLVHVSTSGEVFGRSPYLSFTPWTDSSMSKAIDRLAVACYEGKHVFGPGQTMLSINQSRCIKTKSTGNLKEEQKPAL